MSNEFETSRIIGGLGIVASELTNCFVQYGARVTLITHHSESELQVKDCGPLQIIHLPDREPFYSAAKKKNQYEPTVVWLRRNQWPLPDVIHIHSVCFANLAHYYRKVHGIPIVYTCHSLVKQEARTAGRGIVSDRQERLCTLADRIVVPSNWLKNVLQTNYPECKRKIDVIENGIRRTAPHDKKQRTSLLFVGRLTRQKGIEELLAAVAMLAKRAPYVKLTIIGRASTAAYQARLITLVKKWKLEPYVKWLGFLPPQQVAKQYAKHGVVIVPSKQESFGLVALEALANGIALASTRSGGLSQFVSSKVAEVIPAVTSRAIAGSVINIWRDGSRTEERIRAGFKRTEMYDWRKIAARYMALFERLPKHPIESTTAVQLEDGRHD
ncbi:glycosyltransferase family 1 protein [Brevibacillus fluminis]|uniref:Glycosyltransferase family 1 protein n=1 Tax=Brevibacillus fluminis TaxID=511487 RepID=A0A3M8D9X6_9BACL|nr:glycosyltransferase family 4 protein [Brevibacillus fluminis]RNB84459.1 glycosyltransferase family 1 protein [Brevibacillus fluminis]